ncbi:hotdog fold domain-containing protein [Nesterenkonia aerolata]|uniref:Hotdog fold domain-containing protein n=1 Tax=Nesterenkonia aerolata TaxID=3074079 RepID=A0ABU2DTG3_9MICC|nr:hotdog fold domain-containing protein [Nesterenkonia sp. LY-0111]MDR8019793.1 hotdog fold domain-containing protein [Nesterenkonia sp. LY-0111]
MSETYALYRRLTSKSAGLGRIAFSAAYMLKVPYFRTVRPMVQSIEPHRAVVRIRRRWSTKNHIGTLHAIAVANGLEAAMGLLSEATVPDHQRWIPKGIHLDYLAKTPGDVECLAETSPEDWAQTPPFQIDVRVSARLISDGTTVVEGTIPIHVSERTRSGRTATQPA